MSEQSDRTELEQIQQLIMGRQFGEALEQLVNFLQSDAQHQEALYMKAVCERYLTDYVAALDTLNTLKTLAPDFGRAHQEEGHTHKAMGNLDEALAAYQRASRANPALEASWLAQLDILVGQGRAGDALQVKAQLDYLQALPKPLVGVMDLISQGRLVKAEALCRQFLQKIPHHVEAMRLLAEIGVRLGVLDDADFLLESAVRFEPENSRVRIDYIQVLRKRQQFERALVEAGNLLEKNPDNPQFQSLYAIECMQTGDYDAALAMFDRVLARVPGDPGTLVARGHALKTRGDFDGAVAAYRDAIGSERRHGESWYALANLKTYSFGAEDISEMRALESGGNLSHMDQVYVCFALGKAYEDEGDFESSFRFYDRGNSLKKAQSRYNAERMSQDLQAQRVVCTASLFAEKAGQGFDAPDPIFIVGLPRAGSTLLEQILSSHSQVDGTLELPNILALTHKLRRGGQMRGEGHYPGGLPDLSAVELESFGRQYIDETRVHRQSAPFFIDKMPNNFRHIGLIKLILPNAKIIDARRAPMACYFSGFKQLFAEGQEFTYSLSDIGRYYRDYVALMDHWDQVLPGFVLRVQHEDLVADLEGQVRRMLDFCGLPFETSCLRYWETERNVRTPSSEQVRRPIFTSALEQWRHYEPYLGPLVESLKHD